jgi:hypothetical protein
VSNRRKDQEADEHPATLSFIVSNLDSQGGNAQRYNTYTGNKGLATAVVLDNIEAVKGYTEVNTVLEYVSVKKTDGVRCDVTYENHLSDKRVVNSCALEDDRSIVEEVI